MYYQVEDDHDPTENCDAFEEASFFIIHLYSVERA